MDVVYWWKNRKYDNAPVAVFPMAPCNGGSIFFFFRPQMCDSACLLLRCTKYVPYLSSCGASYVFTFVVSTRVNTHAANSREQGALLRQFCAPALMRTAAPPV